MYIGLRLGNFVMILAVYIASIPSIKYFRISNLLFCYLLHQSHKNEKMQISQKLLHMKYKSKMNEYICFSMKISLFDQYHIIKQMHAKEMKFFRR